MAPKKATPMEVPPSASSSSEEEEMTSEEEEEVEEEEEEESSSEEEEEKTQKPSVPLPQTQVQTPKPAPDKLDSVKTQVGSESEGESGSGSDSDEPESDSEPESTVKPIASKPMAAEGATPVKNTKPSASKLMGAEETIPVKSTMPKYNPSEKRVRETDRSPTDAKRAKQKDVETGENSEDAKKQLKGKWNEDDEIALLEGILDYTKKKGIDPWKDLSKEMDSFHEFIKKRLHFNVNTTQLKDKIWRTKKKFSIDVRGNKGKDVTFSKPHDQKLSDLAKKLWGNGIISEGGTASSIKSNGKVEKSENNINQRRSSKTLAALKSELGINTGNEEADKSGKTKVEVSQTLGLKSFGEMADHVLREGLDAIDREKKAEMENKWRELHVEEMKLFLKQIELLKEQTKLNLAYYKGQGN